MFANLHLDKYDVGFPAIIITIGIILYLQSLLKRHLGAEAIAECHEVGSYYLSMVGTFYAVLLGLIVVDAMTKFQGAASTVDRETTALLKIYSSAERFPEQRSSIEQLVTDYAKEVIDVEFPMMERDGVPDMKVTTISLEILEKVKAIEPVTENQKAIFPILLSDVSDLLITRRERTKVSNFGEPPVEWFMLLTGGFMTIVLTFFFTIESHGVHMFMRTAVASTVLMSLYLTYLFGSPFSGDLKVSSDPFKAVFNYGAWAAKIKETSSTTAPTSSTSEKTNLSSVGMSEQSHIRGTKKKQH